MCFFEEKSNVNVCFFFDMYPNQPNQFWQHIDEHLLSKSCIFSVITIYFRGRSKISQGNMAIALGYLSSDLLLILVDMKNWNSNIGYIIHHSVSVFAYYLSLSTGLLAYFGNFRLLAEVSTPCVNLRWALAVTNKKKEKIYLYNGFVMTCLFFICRIVVMPYYYYLVMQVAGTNDYRKHLSTPLHLSWLTICVVLDCLNIYWFLKMVSGVRKHLIKSTAKKE